MTSDSLYARDYLPVVVGLESRDSFLRRMAPDYEVASFLNRTIAPQQLIGNEKVMVFFRHLYYVQVPIVNGDPETSWLVDPARCASPEEMLGLMRRLQVHWVVKTGIYPTPLEDAFTGLELVRKIVPVASEDVNNLSGLSRIFGIRVSERVVILQVAD
jgi:hypothetical protein